jgi:hypothetical protein
LILLVILIIQGDVESSIVPEDIERLSGDAYIEINTFLTSGENTNFDPLHLQLDPHMIRCKGDDGAVEWVSAEGKQAWEDMHCRSQGADFVPITFFFFYAA